MPESILTPAQQRVAAQVLAEESSRRHHLAVALSGAHAYGFPSPDSDLDLKAIHVAPTRSLLGLTVGPMSFDRMEVIDGVEVDYTSNELQMVLLGVIKGNGNYLERMLGPILLQSSAELESLRPLVLQSLSQKMHGHYRGFATSQLHELEKDATPPAKRALYVLRTALTGAHALATGEIVTDLARLGPQYGFTEVSELIATKRSGERVLLDARQKEEWRGRAVEALVRLEQERQRSKLPAECPNAAELEAWLLEVRESSTAAPGRSALR